MVKMVETASEKAILIQYLIKISRSNGRGISPAPDSCPLTILENVDVNLLIRALELGSAVDLINCQKQPTSLPSARRTPDAPQSDNPFLAPRLSPSLTAKSNRPSAAGSTHQGDYDNPFLDPPKRAKSGEVANPFLVSAKRSPQQPASGKQSLSGAKGLGVAKEAPVCTVEALSRNLSAPLSRLEYRVSDKGVSPAGPYQVERRVPYVPAFLGLNRGLSSEHLQSLAWLLLASVATGPGGNELLEGMQGQLGVSVKSTADLRNVLQSTRESLGGSLVEPLDLVAYLAGGLTPHHFSGADAFERFLALRKIGATVLAAAASELTTTKGGSNPSAKSFARFRAALRRVDVSGPEEFDAEEYAEGGGAVRELAHSVIGERLPTGIALMLCVTICNAVYEVSDPSTRIPFGAPLLSTCNTSLWPLLGVSSLQSNAALCWSTFRAWAGTGESRCLRQLTPLIRDIALPSVSKGSEETGLPQTVLQAILDFTSSSLSDIYASFPEASAEKLTGTVNVYVAASLSNGKQPAEADEQLLALISTSVSCQHERSKGDIGVKGMTEEAELLKVIAVTSAMAEQSAYASALSGHFGPAASGVLACFLTRCAAKYIGPYLRTLRTLDQEVLQVVRAAEDLSKRLSQAVTNSRNQSSPTLSLPVSAMLASITLWDVESALKGALTEWVKSQVSGLVACVSRALSAETWRPTGSAPGPAGSARDMGVLLHEVVDALFDMRLPLSEETMANVVGGISSVVQRYTKHVLDNLGDVERLIPPVPLPTRFKMDRVKKQEEAEVQGGKTAMLLSVETIDKSPHYVNISQSLKMPVLLCMVASLAHLSSTMDSLVEHVAKRWSECSPSTVQSVKNSNSSGGSATVNPRAKVTDLMGPASRDLLAAEEYVCRFMATKLIFWDMRQQWCELLYRHHVQTDHPLSCHLSKLVSELGHVMGGEWGVMGSRERIRAATWLFRMCVKALERVLTDGGPCRWFTIDDVPFIKSEMEQLRTFFWAKGQGLPKNILDSGLEQLNIILDVMASSTGELISILHRLIPQKARSGRLLGATFSFGSGSTPAAPIKAEPIDGPAGQLSEDTIIRILARRPDRSGSKVLKKDFNVPKKL